MCIQHSKISIFIRNITSLWLCRWKVSPLASPFLMWFLVTLQLASSIPLTSSHQPLPSYSTPLLLGHQNLLPGVYLQPLIPSWVSSGLPSSRKLPMSNSPKNPRRYVPWACALCPQHMASSILQLSIYTTSYHLSPLAKPKLLQGRAPANALLYSQCFA